MNTIKKNPISGLEEDIRIGEFKENAGKKEYNALLDFFRSKQMLGIIQNRTFTTKEASILIGKINLEVAKVELVEYYNKIKEAEKGIINYLLDNALLSKSDQSKNIKLIFKGDFTGIDPKLLDLIGQFTLNKGSFKNELKKISAPNGEYIMDIKIEMNDGEFIILDLTIKKSPKI